MGSKIRERDEQVRVALFLPAPAGSQNQRPGGETLAQSSLTFSSPNPFRLLFQLATSCAAASLLPRSPRPLTSPPDVSGRSPLVCPPHGRRRADGSAAAPGRGRTARAVASVLARAASDGGRPGLRGRRRRGGRPLALGSMAAWTAAAWMHHDAVELSRSCTRAPPPTLQIEQAGARVRLEEAPPREAQRGGAVRRS